jgi:hypothetical protein
LKEQFQKINNFIAINLSDSLVQGLRTEQMPADGSCLFHALAHQILRLKQAIPNLTTGVFSFAFCSVKSTRSKSSFF